MDNNNKEMMVKTPSQKVPGKSTGIACFVVGLTSVLWGVVWYLILGAVLSYGSSVVRDNASASGVLSGLVFVETMCMITPIVNVVLGVVGIVLSSFSKRKGYHGGLRGAGFAMSLVMLILGSLCLVSCLACIGCTGLAVKDMYSELLDKLFSF